MQYQVPQFTEVEDKIFGPLTFKQFVYILGAAASAFLFWRLLPKWLAVLLIVPISGFFLALAFLKINGQPLLKVLTSALNFSIGSRLYIWKKTEEKPLEKKEETLAEKEALALPKLTESKLKELAWSLDIHQKLKR
ncbi:MAG: PrgI family protein [Candidatus Niyogibacteria bacterium]|nr:PrgI family protein [Candidatus Niyogibacteria bacterium]